MPFSFRLSYLPFFARSRLDDTQPLPPAENAFIPAFSAKLRFKYPEVIFFFAALPATQISLRSKYPSLPPQYLLFSTLSHRTDFIPRQAPFPLNRHTNFPPQQAPTASPRNFKLINTQIIPSIGKLPCRTHSSRISGGKLLFSALLSRGFRSTRSATSVYSLCRRFQPKLSAGFLRQKIRPAKTPRHISLSPPFSPCEFRSAHSLQRAHHLFRKFLTRRVPYKAPSP